MELRMGSGRFTTRSIPSSILRNCSIPNTMRMLHSRFTRQREIPFLPGLHSIRARTRNIWNKRGANWRKNPHRMRMIFQGKKMAENDTENFALGIIVAILVYLIFRKQIDRAIYGSGAGGAGGAGGASRFSGGAGGAGAGGAGGGGGCGCASPCNPNKTAIGHFPTNPGISL